jgi:hypothetical protein
MIIIRGREAGLAAISGSVPDSLTHTGKVPEQGWYEEKDQVRNKGSRKPIP